MALLASQCGVAARERKSRLPVIYRLAAWLPVYEREVCSVVIGVALDAIFARSLCSDPNRVHAAILGQPVPNFGVAIQAFELDAART